MNDHWNIEQHRDFVNNMYMHEHEEGEGGTEGQILPAQDKVFSALSFMKPAEVKALILGQDPYPTPGDAHGLAFSVEHGKAPRSLKNIFIELEKDYPDGSRTRRENANLSDWAQQGVLLLNAVLTVPAGNAGGHERIGWQKITQQLLQQVAEKSPYAVWMLWGSKAHKTAQKLVPDHHDLLQCGHPSPLAYNQNRAAGFKNCGHFKRCNELLMNKNQQTIDWLGS